MTLIIQKPTGAKLVLAKDFSFDADAAVYIAAVEAADTQALETATRYAINDFVIGCKQDGIWPAIKASCILAGARTLTGALVPLVGAAPTNNNFVSGDYNRKTGLLGNSSTKQLNSNRNNNADPQNNKHISVFASALPTSSPRPLIGMDVANTTGSTFIYNTVTRVNDGINSSYSAVVGFIGLSRNQSNAYDRRNNNTTTVVSASSANPISGELCLFRDGGGAGFFGNPQISFYSIGESLNLGLLDARVTTLINAFAAAIP